MAIARFLDRMCLALRASGLWLHYTMLQNLIPSFPWIAPPRPPPWRNPRKGRDQTLPSGNLDCTHRLGEVRGEVVLHHVEGGGGRLVARDGRDGVGPRRDDDRLVVVLGGGGYRIA